jgi:integration host factor subunit alpha
MGTLTKREIAEVISARLGFSLRTSLQLVDVLFQQLKRALLEGKEAKIVRFGTIRLVERPARRGVNPADGRPITILARRTVAFHPSRALKKLVNHRQSLGDADEQCSPE